uniref:Uncharacterized protein n=1 Tax=Rhodnius prolixus TaxID=13249 RepID=T1H7U1_RHOPR
MEGFVFWLFNVFYVVK